MKLRYPGTYRTIFLILILIIAGCATPAPVTYEQPVTPAIEPVPAGKFDTGKMWTFDFPPIEYFAETYNFNPSYDWFEHARLAALRLPNCSASFVSGGGLVLTNHHCVLGALERVTLEGENLLDNGFYAKTLEDERIVEGLYLDQLVLTEDVTAEIIAAFEQGATDDERVRFRQQKISEIENGCSEETGYRCNVITFYNGGRYSLYGYKRYNDVRMVYAPESAIGFFGGDPDNFTYPRYNLDVAFLRVYDEEGNPYQPEYFFNWSNGGAGEGDAVFVIGNPGRTGRLLTFSQLEFNRDKQYPFIKMMIDNMVGVLHSHIQKYPEKRTRYETRLFGLENSQKLYDGILDGLHDPHLMGRKVDFENTFKTEVEKRIDLQREYGALWNEIAELQLEKRKIFEELQALSPVGLGRSTYFSLASNIVEYADQIGLPEEQRQEKYRSDNIDATIEGIYPEAGIDVELEEQILKLQLGYMKSILGKDDPVLRILLGDRSPGEAAGELVSNSILSDRERTEALLNQGRESIRMSDDPFITYIQNVKSRVSGLRGTFSRIESSESARVQQLGKALYEIYDTSIPPDATFTLRIADGVVKSYEYNGTIAPPYTTFYGLYDRHYSHGRVHPWALPEQWITPPGEFNMSTPVNFVSTNDIIGGNSGSPVINIDLEVVGLVFDGNIESLSGNFIYTEEYNRSVSVHSDGILEALRYMYDAQRIVYELQTGKLR